MRLFSGSTSVVSVQEEEGWLRGRLRGKTGVFPSNFVRLSPAETDRPKSKIYSTETLFNYLFSQVTD